MPRFPTCEFQIAATAEGISPEVRVVKVRAIESINVIELTEAPNAQIIRSLGIAGLLSEPEVDAR